MPAAASNRTFRLADAVVLLLLVMLPVMLMLGAAEGRAGAPTPLFFWLLLLFPLLLVLWLLTCCEPEETADGARAAALHVSHQPDVAAQFEALVAPYVRPLRSYADGGVPVVEGTPRTPKRALFSELERRLTSYQLAPLVEELDQGQVRIVGLPKAAESRLQSRSSPIVNLVLFAATVMTTVYAGARQQGVYLIDQPGQFLVGLPYALSLLAVLGVHELGHYVIARWHGVDVTLPYFIPVPTGLGTFGAFIQMKSLMKTRRTVFDIGIAGPLAGLAVAIPLLYFGAIMGPPESADQAGFAVDAGASLFLALLHQIAHGGDLGAATVSLSPAVFAGWIGVFITALNLLPVGQLDGGHIAYALFGRRYARTISIATVSLMALLGISIWPGLLTWALIVTLMAGFSHMPALDDVTPPDGKRFALGLVTLALPILIMMPVPRNIGTPTLDSPYAEINRMSSSVQDHRGGNLGWNKRVPFFVAIGSARASAGLESRLHLGISGGNMRTVLSAFVVSAAIAMSTSSTFAHLHHFRQSPHDLLNDADRSWSNRATVRC